MWCLVALFLPGLALSNSAWDSENATGIVCEFLGPDTVFVDESCTGILEWDAENNPVCDNETPGGVILTQTLHSISGGYEIGDSVMAGVEVEITYRITDNMGNIEFFSFSIYFADTIPPTFDSTTLPPQDTTIFNIENYPPVPILATDNCDPDGFETLITVEESELPDLCTGGEWTRTYIATDPFGNQAFYIQTITQPPDTINPEFVVGPSDTIVDCENMPDAYTNWLDNQYQNIVFLNPAGGEVNLSDDGPTLSELEGFCGDLSVQFFAQDTCGNTGVETAVFSVLDTIDPTISVPPAPLFVNCEDGMGMAEFQDWIENNGYAEAEDNCGPIQWELSPQPGEQAFICNDTFTVNWIAIDPCGNATSETAQVFLMDTTGPVFQVLPSDQLYECDDDNLESAFLDWLDNAGGAQATDGCSSTGLISYEIYFEGQSADSEDLWMELLEGIESGCTDSLTVGDSLVSNILSFVEVEFRYSDFCGNTSTASARFAIKDDLAPEIVIPAGDFSMQCTNDSLVEIEFLNWYSTAGGMEAEDNCSEVLYGADLNFQQSWEQFLLNRDTSCGMTSNVELIFFAEDLCGNRTYADLPSKFETIDTLPPVLIIQPQELSMQCNTDVQGVFEQWISELGNVELSEECGDWLPVEFEWNSSAGESGIGVPAEGPYPQVLGGECNAFWNFVFTVQDECGNTTQFESTASLSDTISPSFEGTADTVYYSCNGDLQSTQVEVVDLCSEFDLSFTDSLVSNSWQGCGDFEEIWERSYVAEDVCGNRSEFLQIMVVSDFGLPSFSVPPDITTDCELFGDTSITGVPTNLEDDCFSAGDLTLSYEDWTEDLECNPLIYRIWYLTDPCGNTAVDTQVIQIIDTLSPQILSSPNDLVLFCGDESNEGILEMWLMNGGGAQVEDNCGEIEFFAAVPGSYDPTDSSSFPGTSFEIPQLPSCTAISDSSLVEAEVDFVFYDHCGNLAIETAVVSLIDNTAPEFLHCPEEMLVEIEGEDCIGVFHLPEIAIWEACGAESEIVFQMDTVNLESDDPGNPNSVVNPFELVFSNVCENDKLIGSLELEVQLIGVDGEQATEFFLVYDRDGNLIGQTENTISQCGNSTSEFEINDIEAINRWCFGDTLVFYLEPYETDSLSDNFFVNDICSPGLVVGTLQVERFIQRPLEVTYQIGYGSAQPIDQFPTMGMELNSGNYPLLFSALDCSGNKSECETTLIVNDNIAPDVNCGMDISGFVGIDDCEFSAQIPDLDYTDNCAEYGISTYSHALDSFEFLEFFQHPDLNDFQPAEVVLTFSKLQPTSSDEVQILLEVKADLDDEYAYFEVFASNGQLLGDTRLNGDFVTEPGNCDTPTLALFTLSDSLFNALLDNGRFEISIRPFSNIPIPPGGPGFGINPCNDSVEENGDTDDVSYVRAVVTHHPVRLDIWVEGQSPADTLSIYRGEPLPEMGFPPGISLLQYIAYDPWGNTAQCEIEVEVSDTISPEAICKNALVEVFPSVLDTLQIQAETIDGGSLDNCSIENYKVIPSEFNCENVGDEVEVVLIVEDEFGNSDSCSSIVRIEAVSLQPSFILELCNPDTLQLFSNAPGDPALYSYQWSGPQGFSSTSPNPLLSSVGPINSGNYSLTITGFGGCMAEGSVDVSISTIATPFVEAVNEVVCEGDRIQLMASSYSGQIEYNWFSGSPPSGVLLGTTQQPAFSISLPEGDQLFYVVVENPDCSSNPSAPVQVEVLEEPQAEVSDPFIRLCAGEPLALSSPLGPSFSYSWTGPAGFVSDMQSPLVTNSASSINAGTYTLVVELGSCVSEPVTVQVAIDQSPPQPIIQGTELICLGDSVHLRVPNIPIATRYIWSLPDGSEQFSTNNQILISNAGLELGGEWSVTVDFGQCSSIESDPFLVQIDQNPSIEIFSNSPVCQGDTVVLSATSLNGAQLQWSGPGGFSSTMDTIRDVLASGTYQLDLISASGCTATATESISVKTRPEINAIINQGLDCVDGNSDFCFRAVVSPSDSGDLVYDWSGPAQFSSSQSNPCVSQIDEINNGVYELVVTLDGCSSDTAFTEVEVTNIDFDPEFTSVANQYCEGDTILLRSTVGPQAGFRFHWVTPMGISISSDSFLVLQNVDGSMSGQYTHFITVEQCTTLVSDERQIEINPVPPRPSLTGGGEFCEGDSILLITNDVPGINYQWEGPVTLDQAVSEQLLWPAKVSNSGTYRVFAEMDGCLSVPSLPQNVIVNMEPAPPILELDRNAICLDDEFQSIEICLDSDSLPGGFAIEYFLNDEISIPFATSNSLCYILQTAEIDQDGSNTIQARAEVNGCISSFSAPVEFRADIIPDELAFAGEDFVSCNADSAVLVADFPMESIGEWSSPNPFIDFEGVNMPVGEVYGLAPGINTIIWSLSNGSCRNFDRDTVQIDYLGDPVARDDTLSLYPGQSQVIDVLSNDSLPAAVNIEILEISGQGRISLDELDRIVYQSNERWSGTVIVEYEICLTECNDKCDIGQLRIRVGDDQDCSIPNIFTPNFDGINDAFIIPCLSGANFPNNELKIFDQWGSELFRAAPYRNNWEGTKNGQPLTDGTYFYVLDFGDGRSPVSGFVIIKR